MVSNSFFYKNFWRGAQPFPRPRPPTEKFEPLFENEMITNENNIEQISVAKPVHEVTFKYEKLWDLMASLLKQ